MRRIVKFWFLLSLEVFIFILVIVLFVVAKLFLYTILMSVCFLFGFNLLYRRVYKGMKPKYPEMPPDGKPDVYYGSGIPRPIYEDVRRFPWFFKKRHKKSQEETKAIQNIIKARAGL